MIRCEVTVESGERSRPACLVHVPVELPEMEGVGGVEVQEGGRSVPAQFEHDPDSGTVQVWFMVEPLQASGSRRYEMTLLGPGETASEDRTHSVNVVDAGDRVDIAINEQLFTSYHCGTGLARPYFHPVIAANGARVTRSWPMDPDAEGEVRDHPHHRGLWVAHGDVNGVDNWSEEASHGCTRHVDFHSLRSGLVRGNLSAESVWHTPGGAVLLREMRHAAVHELPGGIRVLDIDLHLTAEQDVTFGDTKEGGICSVRVATSMTAERGGRIENAEGKVGEKETWGKQSDWCDYSGVVNGETVGVAILDHPESFRHPTYWHVRAYGLMTANPFGVAAFTGDEAQNGSHALATGETIVFRYRVLVHGGNASEADIAGHYYNWTDPPKAIMSA